MASAHLSAAAVTKGEHDEQLGESVEQSLVSSAADEKDNKLSFKSLLCDKADTDVSPCLQLAPFLSADDPDAYYYNEIYHFLKEGWYPEDASNEDKRALKKRAAQFVIKDDVLFYNHRNPRTVITDTLTQNKLVADSHIDVTGVHHGVRKMYQKIFSKWYWKTMYTDISTYVRSCRGCSEAPNSVSGEAVTEADGVDHSSLCHTSISMSKAWKNVQVKLYGPFSRTLQGTEHLAVLLDVETLFAVAQALPPHTLESNCASFLLHTFCRLGFAQCQAVGISSSVLDNIQSYYKSLRESCAATLNSLAKDSPRAPGSLSSALHSCTSLWEPIDKLVESVVGRDGLSWDVEVQHQVFRYNTTAPPLRQSPFSLMFARDPTGYDVDSDDEHKTDPTPAGRRRLRSSLLQCRHCDNSFTSKISFRIHQRKHTEDAMRRGSVEGELLDRKFLMPNRRKRREVINRRKNSVLGSRSPFTSHHQTVTGARELLAIPSLPAHPNTFHQHHLAHQQIQTDQHHLHIAHQQHQLPDHQQHQLSLPPHLQQCNNILQHQPQQQYYHHPHHLQPHQQQLQSQPQSSHHLAASLAAAAVTNTNQLVTMTGNTAINIISATTQESNSTGNTIAALGVVSPNNMTLPATESALVNNDISNNSSCRLGVGGSRCDDNGDSNQGLCIEVISESPPSDQLEGRTITLDSADFGAAIRVVEPSSESVAEESPEKVVQDKQVRERITASTVAAVKSLLAATKVERSVRGKYGKYSPELRNEIAKFALQEGIKQACAEYSTRLGTPLSESTVRNFVKTCRRYSPRQQEEMVKFAGQHGFDRASQHYSEKLGFPVKKDLIRKFKKCRTDAVNNLENFEEVNEDVKKPCVGECMVKRNYSDQMKLEIGHYACQYGIPSAVQHYSEKLQFPVKQSTVRKFKKQFIENDGCENEEAVFHDESNINRDETMISHHHDGVNSSIHADANSNANSQPSIISSNTLGSIGPNGGFMYPQQCNGTLPNGPSSSSLPNCVLSMTPNGAQFHAASASVNQNISGYPNLLSASSASLPLIMNQGFHQQSTNHSPNFVSPPFSGNNSFHQPSIIHSNHSTSTNSGNNNSGGHAMTTLALAHAMPSSSLTHSVPILGSHYLTQNNTGSSSGNSGGGGGTGLTQQQLLNGQIHHHEHGHHSQQQQQLHQLHHNQQQSNQLLACYQNIAQSNLFDGSTMANEPLCLLKESQEEPSAASIITSPNGSVNTVPAIDELHLKSSAESVSTRVADKMKLEQSASVSVEYNEEEEGVPSSRLMSNRCVRRRGRMRKTASSKRGNYVSYCPELRAAIGRFAATHGNLAAVNHFKQTKNIEIPESTVRGLKEKYLSKKMNGDKEVTCLGFGQRGRPMILGKYDGFVKECILQLVKTGEKVSSFLIVATAKQVLMQHDPSLLEENGGPVKLNPTWAKSFMRRMGLHQI